MTRAWLWAVCALAVRAQAPLTISTISLPPAAVDAAYRQPISATGGALPYVFTASNLPVGFSMSTNGVIIGVPSSSGTATIVVTVTDANKQSATRSLTLVILVALDLTVTSLPSGSVGQPYALALTASGGSTPYSFSATGLPAGVAIARGILGGTPSQAGSYSVAITVEDDSNRSRTKIYSLSINSALGFTNVSLVNALVGRAYFQTIGAIGGTPPYNFSAANLPVGLALTPQGTLSGTPTQSGAFNPAVTVTDSQGKSVSKQFPISVTAGPIITTASLAIANLGQAYSQTLTADGGTAPYAFAATGLPAGFTLSSAGVLSGNPVTTGTSNVTITVTDARQSQDSRQFALTLTTAPSLQTPSPLSPAGLGVSYSVLLNTTGGAAPYRYALSANTSLPPGLALSASGAITGTPAVAGTFTFGVQVSDSNQSQSSRTYQLSVLAASQLLTVKAPDLLDFAAVLGGDNPGPQNIAVTSPDTSQPRISLTVDDGKGGPAPAWLRYSLTPLTGKTPVLIRVTPNIVGLGVGTYTARFRISLQAFPAGSQEVPVRLTISDPPPDLRALPKLLRFSGRTTAPKSVEQTFTLRNFGGGPPIPVSVSLKGKSPWVTKLTTSGATVRPGNPVIVTVGINTAGLAAGYYRDSIRVTDTLEIPVTLNLFGPGPVLTLLRDGIRFNPLQGNKTSRQEAVVVRNFGDDGSTVNWTARAIRGGEFVILNTPSGSSTPGNPSAFGVRITSAAAATLDTKSALIQITAPGSQSSPQFVNVVINVSPVDAPPIPDPEPAGVGFLATVGNASPPSQTVSVEVSSETPVPYLTSVSTDDGVDWLRVSPPAGLTSLDDPDNLKISVAPASLDVGTYTGLVNIAIGSIVRAVNVTLVVRSGNSNAQVVAASRERLAGCVPSSLAILQTQLPSNFAVPSGWPATVTVLVADNCGNPVNDASVVASFSNGDPPLSLESDQSTGTYRHSWQPGFAQSATTITLEATSGALTPAHAELPGTVDPNATPAPSLVIAGLLNNFTPTVGGPLAPGTVAQVYGQNLTNAPASTPTPLPLSFRGVEALVGGIPAPIYFISPNQLTVQIPSDVPLGQQYALLVANGQYSQPQPIAIAAVAPGILAFTDGTLIAQHGDGSLVDAAHPARPSETLVTYLVGMGATNPSVPSGTAAPSNPLARTPSTVRMTVDGQSAVVSYAGLSPGWVGLYQVNFQIPATARQGTLDVVLTQDGVSANTTKLIVGR